MANFLKKTYFFFKFTLDFLKSRLQPGKKEKLKLKLFLKCFHHNFDWTLIVKLSQLLILVIFVF